MSGMMCTSYKLLLPGLPRTPELESSAFELFAFEEEILNTVLCVLTMGTLLGAQKVIALL